MTDSLEPWSRVLRDRFVLEREIDRRGPRIAFSARAVEGDRRVVVHAFEAREIEASAIDALQSRLERAAPLRHAHILPIESIGRRDGALYFVTPFVEGVTLATWLEREKVLPFLEAARVLAELAQALAHAHRRGVVHADLSTADVLWSETHVQLCNLGASIGASARCSETDAIGADIRAFGAIAYEVLTGQKPSRANATLGARARAIAPNATGPSAIDASAIDPQAIAASTRIVPVNELRHHIPPGLAYVVMRCLSADGKRAWRSMDDILPLVTHLVTPPPGYAAPQLVNQGAYLCRRPGPLLRESLERFESAIAIDPACARAQAGVAHASCLLALYGYERAPSARARAKRAAERALAIDAKLVDAHLASGFVHFVLERDFDAARRDLDTAIALASGRQTELARAHSMLALLLTFGQPRLDDAIDHARRAVAFDPHSADACSVLARSLAASGRHDESLEYMRCAVELDPSWHHGRELGLCLAFAGRHAESIDALRRATDESDRHPWALSALAGALVTSDARGESESYLRELIDRAQPAADAPFAQPARIAEVAAALGRIDEAASWRERARSELDPALMFSIAPAPSSTNQRLDG
jgi:tetratricopeptide (TPR) repeat protein